MFIYMTVSGLPFLVWGDYRWYRRYWVITLFPIAHR